MTTQLDLFTARDEAIARALDHADEEWKAEAVRVIVRCSRELPEFTTDDVWDRLDSSFHTHEPRALGGLMTSLSSQGLIKATDRFRTSKRSQCHNRPMRVWQAA